MSGVRGAFRIGSHSGVLLLCAIAAGTANATIEVLDVQRFVFATSAVTVSEVFSDEDGADRQRGGEGSFLEAAVTSTGLSDISNAGAESTQDSGVGPSVPGGGLEISGGGSAGGFFDVNDPGFPSSARMTAGTGFSILFRVGTAVPVSVSVALSADLQQLDRFSGGQTPLPTVFAFASFSGAAGGEIFSGQVAGSLLEALPVTDMITVTGVLEPDLYLLELGTEVSFEGIENAAGRGLAGFGVELTILPEPGTGTLVAAGLAALGLARRRTARGPAQERREFAAP